MRSLEIYFSDFQFLLVAQDSSLYTHRRARDKMVLPLQVHFYLKKNLREGISLNHKRKLVLHRKNDRLRDSNGPHALKSEGDEFG